MHYKGVCDIKNKFNQKRTHIKFRKMKFTKYFREANDRVLKFWNSLMLQNMRLCGVNITSVKKIILSNSIQI